MDNSGNIDFDELRRCARVATRALNDVLDEGLPLHPLEEQRKSVGDWRQIGLGIMGVADMFIKMGIRYGSPESIQICEKIASCILNAAVFESGYLASINMKPFPKYNYNKLIKSEFYRKNVSEENKAYIKEYGLYNSQLLTIAPTGTLSTMIRVSGGVEPIFANYYTRKTESLFGEDVYFKVFTPIVKQYMDDHGLTDDSELPDYFVTSADIKPIDRIRIQAAWQQYIDASISSTVNLPEDATVDDIADIYLNAYRNGLKGITVFRSGCRRAGILTTSNSPEKPEGHGEKPDDATPTMPRGFIIDTSDNLIGKKRKLMTGCGSLHCTAFFDPVTGDLMETYLSRGSTGGCANSYTGLSRMISLAARSGVGIDAIIDQLNSCGVCPSYAVRRATKHDTSPGACCPIAIGNALKDMWNEMQSEICDDTTDEGGPTVIDKVLSVQVKDRVSGNIVFDLTGDICPECGEPLIHEGGCDICKNCGWSKCQ